MQHEAKIQSSRVILTVMLPSSFGAALLVVLEGLMDEILRNRGFWSCTLICRMALSRIVDASECLGQFHVAKKESDD